METAIKRSAQWWAKLFEHIRGDVAYFSNGEPKREDRAWAAGFFDGEGWVGLKAAGKDRPKRYAGVSITQLDREVLDRFHKIVEVGTVLGPYDAVGRKNPLHTWNVNGLDGLMKVFIVLKPWLGSIKHKQFIDAITDYLEQREED